MRRSLIAVSFVLLSNASYADPVYCKMDTFSLNNGDLKIAEYTITGNKYRKENSKKNCSATFDTSFELNDITVLKDSKLNKTKITSGVKLTFYAQNIGNDEITIKRTWKSYNDIVKSATVTYKLKIVDHEL